MSKIFITCYFISIAMIGMSQSTVVNTIVISNNDIVNTATGKIISYYMKGLSEKEISEMEKVLVTIKGITTFNVKSTDKELLMSRGKLELLTDFDKYALEKLLLKFHIETIAKDGNIIQTKDFFSSKYNGVSE